MSYLSNKALIPLESVKNDLSYGVSIFADPTVVVNISSIKCEILRKILTFSGGHGNTDGHARYCAKAKKPPQFNDDVSKNTSFKLQYANIFI